MRRLFTVATCLLLGGLWTSPAIAQEASPASCATTAEDDNVEIAQQWVAVWDSGSVAEFEALVSPDVVHHFGVRPDAVGLEDFQGQVAGFHEGFSDFAATTDDVIADGDLVAVRYTATGTHDGTFFGTAATGNEVTWTGISILRIACGTVAESWSEVSGVELWQQLGLLPAPAATGTPIPDAAAATPAPDCTTTTADENAGIARQYLDIWNTHDTSQFDALASPDVLHHWGQGPDTVGTAALAESTSAFFTAFPDLSMAFDEVMADEDKVVIRWTITATQTGPFFELEPSGVQAIWSGINIYRIACGQVVESWSEADGLGLRSQLMAPAATPAA